VYEYHLKAFGKEVMRRAVANMNAADRLIAVSRVSAESYRKNGVHRDFETIPNGIDMPERHRITVPPAIASLTHSELVLLTVGFFGPEKRIDFSIRTFARLHRNFSSNTRLMIIGEGPLEEYYRSIIRQENLNDYVRIIGQIAPENMAGYYSAADILAHPSVVEGFSMVCLEAMSYGKPVVCTSNIGLVEYLHPGKDAVVVPPDDMESLYHAILDLAKNPSKRRSLGREARRTANQLSWANQVRKIEHLYATTIRRKSDK
jgi:glycosyltransferase involved in cell wall biosynthesis